MEEFSRELFKQLNNLMNLLEAPNLLKYEEFKDRINYIYELALNLKVFYKNLNRVFNILGELVLNAVKIISTLKGLLVLIQGVIEEPAKLVEKDVFTRLALSNVYYFMGLVDRLLRLIKDFESVENTSFRSVLANTIDSGFKVFIEPLNNLRTGLERFERFLTELKSSK